MNEFFRRGCSPVAIGRDRAKLAALGERIEKRIASLHDPAALDTALGSVAAVINCAGPFLDTAHAIVEAAVRSKIHYLDVSAEQESVRTTFETFAERVREGRVVVLPAAGFFGALGDFVATAALGDWARADRIDVAITLDRWWPTEGTRKTGDRNSFPRFVVAGGKLQPIATYGRDPGRLKGRWKRAISSKSRYRRRCSSRAISTSRNFITSSIPRRYEI